ncbi:hypothetical protein DWU89_05055, partial [Parabacteroides acidifaciens]
MEPEMEIRSLYNIGFDTLFKAFKAFADYEMRKQIPAHPIFSWGYISGSPRKVVEKAKNNYFCSMETGYELFLPEGILTYFEVTHADRTATAILIYLDEKDLSEEERSGKHLQSKGFYPPASIHDFPLRGKSLILHVRRRRWVDLDTG